MLRRRQGRRAVVIQTIGIVDVGEDAIGPFEGETYRFDASGDFRVPRSQVPLPPLASDFDP
jgi:hypothetical protein